jgi:hypothetical protein
MTTLLKVLNNLADIKSARGVALRVRTQAASAPSLILQDTRQVLIRSLNSRRAITVARLATALKRITTGAKV